MRRFRACRRACAHLQALLDGLLAKKAGRPLSLRRAIVAIGRRAAEERGGLSSFADAGTPVTLLAATDPRWFERAVERWQDLLLDHANCEKKAASTALALMFAYPEDFELADRMSRLAREELRHFELVQQKLRQLQVPFRRMSPSRYAEGLRKALRRTEPERRARPAADRRVDRGALARTVHRA